MIRSIFLIIVKKFINLSIFILSLFLPFSTVELIRELVVTAPRDAKFLYRYSRVVIESIINQKNNYSVIDLFDQNVRKHPNKPCFIYENSEWSFKEVEMYSRRVAQAFKERVAKGEVVGLMMSSKCHYIPIWLGLGRLGVITALINTNQKHKPLIHSITSVKPKIIIFSPDMASGLADIVSKIDPDIDLYCLGETSSNLNFIHLQELIAQSDPDYSKGPKLNYTDTLMYIYTSGSTGLPKAAVVPHCRFMAVATLVRHVMGVTSDDRVYCPLPLYHGSGGVLGTASALIIGGTTVIKEKFSASSYFNDCITYKCTVGLYIGETARYMLAALPSFKDKIHNVRLLTGNGLQSEVWQQLYSRFNVPNIYEFYGSTEGNITLINNENVVGSCGYLPKLIPFLRSFLGIFIIKVDENGKPVRDKNDMCVMCKTNEPGLIVGLTQPGSALKKFYGYVNHEEASKHKYIENVINKGDKAFASGDILVEDKLGYFYFKDRIGDTFRWKGENVATSEVEHALRSYTNITECTVYGVQVPGHEGKAGMAAIVDPKLQINLETLARLLEEALPKYAQPMFIRIVNQILYTSTYKVEKYNLQKQGFDPNIIKDPLFYRNGTNYELITLEVFNDIVNGKIQF